MMHAKVVDGIVTIFAFSVFAVGCSTGSLDDPSQWWNATVVDVVRASQIPRGVDRSCMPAAGDDTGNEESTGAIVRYRVGRAPISKAFVVLRQEALLAGDRVLVQPESCRIKRDPTRGV